MSSVTEPGPYFWKTIGMHLVKPGLISRRNKAIRETQTVRLKIRTFGQELPDCERHARNFVEKALWPYHNRWNKNASDNEGLALTVFVYMKGTPLPPEIYVNEVTGRRTKRQVGARVDGFIELAPGNGLPIYRRSFEGIRKSPERFRESADISPWYESAFCDSNFKKKLKRMLTHFFGKAPS